MGKHTENKGTPFANAISDQRLAANQSRFCNWSKHGVPQYQCILCDLEATGNPSMERHLAGKTHTANMGLAPPPPPPPIFSTHRVTPAPQLQTKVAPSPKPALPTGAVPALPALPALPAAAVPIGPPRPKKRGRGNHICLECLESQHDGPCTKPSKDRKVW